MRKERLQMLKNKFNELVNDDVVYEEDGKFVFKIGDDMEVEDSDEVMEKYKDDDNVNCYLGYGDDSINCIEVNTLEDMDEWLDEFVIRFNGMNCYCEGYEELDDDEEFDED